MVDFLVPYNIWHKKWLVKWWGWLLTCIGLSISCHYIKIFEALWKLIQDNRITRVLYYFILYLRCIHWFMEEGNISSKWIKENWIKVFSFCPLTSRTLLKRNKRDFTIEKQIARHFVQYSNVFQLPLPFSATQIITFLNSSISDKSDKGEGV